MMNEQDQKLATAIRSAIYAIREYEQAGLPLHDELRRAIKAAEDAGLKLGHYSDWPSRIWREVDL